MYNVRGGVEPSFMSTTLDRRVAMEYAEASGGGSNVFEINMGMIDRGASLSWLSQYSHEQEVLFAPLCGMVRHGGAPTPDRAAAPRSLC